MKHQFHVGDRVIRVRDGISGYFPVGITGIVTKINTLSGGIYVKPDSPIPHSSGNTEFGYHGAVDYFEPFLEKECEDIKPEELYLVLGVI